MSLCHYPAAQAAATIATSLRLEALTQAVLALLLRVGQSVPPVRLADVIADLDPDAIATIWGAIGKPGKQFTT